MNDPTSVRSVPVERATRALADRGRARALEVSADVLAHVMARPRRSMPVLARAPHRRVHLSEQVVVAVVTHRIARLAEGLAVARVVVTATPDQHLERVLVELVAQYGTDLVAASARAHDIVTSVLREVVGPADDSVEVAVAPTHVHVGDVTVGDPQLSDPHDD